MNKIKKFIDKYTTNLNILLYIYLGFIFIYYNSSFLDWFLISTLIVIAHQCGFNLANKLIKKNKKETDVEEKNIMPKFSYDKVSDVMYISFGKPLKCTTNEMEDGLLHRYTQNGKLNGITIIDYSYIVTGE